MRRFVLWLLCFAVSIPVTVFPEGAVRSSGSADLCAKELNVTRVSTEVEDLIGAATGQEENISDAVSELQIPERTRGVFVDLYDRHGEELLRIAGENPNVLAETFNVLAEVLPALRTVPQNKGVLFIDGNLYARATGLYRLFEGLSSPQLMHDLKKSKVYVDSRVRDIGGGKLRIDLN